MFQGTHRSKIGVLTSNIVTLLNIENIEDNNIYISQTNIEHMKNKHSSDFNKYSSDIEKIIKTPDYIGQNKKDGSIEFVKQYKIENEYVKVAVRVSKQNKYYVRSLYILNNNRVQNFILKGTLIKIS